MSGGTWRGSQLPQALYDRAISEGCGRELLEGRGTHFCDAACAAADALFNESGHCERVAREAMTGGELLAERRGHLEQRFLDPELADELAEERLFNLLTEDCDCADPTLRDHHRRRRGQRR